MVKFLISIFLLLPTFLLALSLFLSNINVSDDTLYAFIIRIKVKYNVGFLYNMTKIINIHDFDYELQIKGAQDMRPAVFDFARDNGLKILNLQLKNESLEQLFKKLTV
jgi:hypothetical protein